MALIKCIECGKEISERVETCIHCGCPNFKKVYSGYGINEKPSFLDVYLALKLILDVNGIKGYVETSNPEEKPRNWLYKNYDFLKKNITVELVSSLSSYAEVDMGVFNDVFGVIDKEKKDREASAQKFRENHAIRYLCKDCGSRHVMKKCFRCGSTNIDEYRVRVLTSEEDKLYIKTQNKIAYILSNVFFDIAPLKNSKEKIGALELCEAANNFYDNKVDFYKIAGVVNRLRFSIDYCDVIFYEGLITTKVYTEDGRKIEYKYWYFNDEKEVQDLHLTDEEIAVLDENPIEEINKCINIINEYKEYSYGDLIFDETFTAEELEVARKSLEEDLEKFMDKQVKKEEREEAQKQIEKLLAQPGGKVDPRVIKGAKCPNCHKETVIPIGTVKRAGTIAAFGLLSRNIGKTMECKSCGYKW